MDLHYTLGVITAIFCGVCMQIDILIPIQQISVQITPILFYFYVYALTPPETISGARIIAGVLLMVSAAFLLGRRQAELEMIK
jgi:hypothetical protein